MTRSTDQESELRQLLRRTADGDSGSLDALLRHQYQRLTLLARRMLSDFPGVKRWSDTDDVLQSAMVRLFGALRDVKPNSPREFLALASLQLRRELIDLARHHYYGPMGIGANHDSRTAQNSDKGNVLDKSDISHEPGALSQWSELHQQIGDLPDDEREVVNHLFYQGLSQSDTAEILQISVRTVQRRWHAALVKLHRVWYGVMS